MEKKSVLAAFFISSCHLTHTNAADHRGQGKYRIPDRRNENAERKTSRSRCCPWRHRHPGRQTASMPWRPWFQPAWAGRNSEHLRRDGRMRTRPAPGQPPARTPASRSSLTGWLPHRRFSTWSWSAFSMYRSVARFVTSRTGSHSSPCHISRIRTLLSCALNIQMCRTRGSLKIYSRY
jgi:hypothetical protein